MTFNGTIEFLLHLESFRNIDLYHQGIYYLKGSIYSQKPNSLEVKFQIIMFKIVNNL